MNNTTKHYNSEELTSITEDEIYYDGMKFKKDYRGYYRCWTGHKGLRLHRYVWEKTNGEIPEGFHVHHKDRDKNNNHIDNLEVMSAKKHGKEHAVEFNKRKLENPPSVEWRKRNYENTKHLMHELVEVECLQCGEVVMKRKYAKYCSRYCRNRFNYIRRKREASL